MRIPSGIADQYLYFVAVDETDLKTRETGLSAFTVYRSRNGGVAAAYTTPTVVELSSSNMPGIYALLLDEDMTVDAGDDSQEVCLHITAAGMAPVTRVFELYRRDVTSGRTLSVESDGGLTALPWNAAWDGEVQSNAAVALAAYDPPTKAELDAAVAPLATASDLSGLATGADLAAVDGVVDAIKAKTDGLSFGVAGKVDANITHVNETEVTGNGSLGNEWGPA